MRLKNAMARAEGRGCSRNTDTSGMKEPSGVLPGTLLGTEYELQIWECCHAFIVELRS